MDTKTLSAEEIAAKAAEKATKAESKRKEKIAKEYPHAMIETLRFDAAAGNGGKYVVNIHCVECGDETREVYTSDLFQINKCTACSDAAKKAKKDQKKADLKATAALLKEKATEVVQA